MSNDFLNHLDQLEKQLWAELEVIEQTRKLWMPMGTKAVQRKEVRPVVKKNMSTGVVRSSRAMTFDIFNPTECINTSGGVAVWKQIEKLAAGGIWMSVIHNPSKAPSGYIYRLQIIDRRRMTSSGQPTRKALVWCKTKDEANKAKIALLTTYESAKLNN